MTERAEQISYLQRLIDRMTGRPASAPALPEPAEGTATLPPRHRHGDGPWMPGNPPSGRSSASPPSRRPPTPATSTPTSTPISWGGASGSSVINDPLHFIGQTDPLEGTVLLAGERVSVCTRCGAAYHLATMSFIRGATGGACVSCGTAGLFQTLTLSAGAQVLTPPPDLVPIPLPSERKPVRSTPVAAPPRDAAGRPIIQLHQVRDHVGEEVAFEGRVLRVHLTGGGAYFLYFERAARVLDGFRAVIRPRDIFHWEIEGILPPDTYPDQWVRIAGKIVDDPHWQLEILIQRPESIEILSGPTESTGWRPDDGHVPEIPDPLLADAPAIKTEPAARVRWLG
jgi:hypothetical protein